MAYRHLEEFGKRIKEMGTCLILGVTGGIASGKTTVVKMLNALGAPFVDLDVIARQVVEPEKPAWKEVVGYFGKQVLRNDGNLDRKRLSNIVFQDREKRGKLEGFTHPYIFEEFFEQVDELAEQNPEAIIQVDVPLLFELNIEYMFHKILLIYIPEELQIKRLAAREGISREGAANMLKAQLSIDKKVGQADFMIHNEKPLEEVLIEVEELWKTLKKLQKERSKSS
jgi:dephospho-CoA kinase